MSGGSHDYAYCRVQDFASEIRGGTRNPNLRQAFADHLELVAKAMHDIEWVDSGDYGNKDEVEAIRAVLAEGAELMVAIRRAEVVQDDLKSAIALALESAPDTTAGA